ncbi:MAG: enoyl-CoA hydratase/isomerase family protein [Deltaproteobacteria bacterium]|nr:enoyl-CoA hydratase/isomerase family protein [Deltaproteobacteria bacterium]
MQYEDIRVDRDGHIVWITIDRPRVLNAFRTQTLEELAHAFDQAGADGVCGVIILTGAGDKAFCTGGDIGSMSSLTPANGRTFLRACRRLSQAMRDCPQPVIAMVNGYAMGGGNELHLFCDLTIASEKAVFGQTGPTVGSVPVWGGTQLLPRIIGEKRAREMVYLCPRIDARKALEWGLCNKVVPHEKLREETRSICMDILAKSPQSLRIAKMSFNHGIAEMDSSFEHGGELLAVCYGGEELGEGMKAFLEKRKPDFNQFRK